MEALMVQFRSGLTGESGEKVKADRRAAFREIPGVLQAYFLKLRDGDEIGAFFLFDSPESREAFLQTDVVQETPEAMKVEGELSRRLFAVTSTLYEET